MEPKFTCIQSWNQNLHPQQEPRFAFKADTKVCIQDRNQSYLIFKIITIHELNAVTNLKVFGAKLF